MTCVETLQHRSRRAQRLAVERVIGSPVFSSVSEGLRVEDPADAVLGTEQSDPA